MSAASFDFLLIEDNPDDAELCLRALQLGCRGARVHVVRDGVEALEFLAREHPRVVLLDLKLPRLDGKDVLRRIKGDPAQRQLPIVVLTSSRESSDICESYRLGANSYIVKPVDSEEFARVVGAVGAYWLAINQSPA